MRISERILLLLSRRPGSADYRESTPEWNLDNALSQLSAVFPDFMDTVVGKDILDFGCGSGWQAAVLARNGAKYVVGIDINLRGLERARQLATRLGVQRQVQFADRVEDRFKSRFDIVISQNSMEHFGDPLKVLYEIKSALRENGRILITFGPPWFAPYGSHMQFLTKMPWVNIIFPEKTVMNVRAYFRDDGATRYEEVKSGLNKMSIAKFERLVAHTGLKVFYRRYQCLKRLDFLAGIPLVRELFINRVSCVLGKDR
jgi:SAM-dependent methyltransferase